MVDKRLRTTKYSTNEKKIMLRDVPVKQPHQNSLVYLHQLDSSRRIPVGVPLFQAVHSHSKYGREILCGCVEETLSFNPV